MRRCDALLFIAAIWQMRRPTGSGARAMSEGVMVFIRVSIWVTVHFDRLGTSRVRFRGSDAAKLRELPGESRIKLNENSAAMIFMF